VINDLVVLFNLLVLAEQMGKGQPCGGPVPPYCTSR